MDLFPHTSPHLNQQNKFNIKVLLALIAEIVAKCSGTPSYMLNKEEIEVGHFSQNILAQTLNQQKYTSNPGFLGFMNSTGLPFKSYDEFKRAAYNKKCQMLGRLRVERGLAGFSLFDDF